MKTNQHSGEGYSGIQVTVRKMIHLDQQGGADFFCDYATQLMDTASYALSIKGPASHDVYNRRQVEAARLRVLDRQEPRVA
jgi:uncharacterized protein (TIGR04562 family)